VVRSGRNLLLPPPPPLDLSRRALGEGEQQRGVLVLLLLTRGSCGGSCKVRKLLSVVVAAMTR
jgi:hypothetical protein